MFMGDLTDAFLSEFSELLGLASIIVPAFMVEESLRASMCSCAEVLIVIHK